METIKFGTLYDRDIVKYVHDITMEASVLKKEIFKTSIMNKELDKDVCSTYLTAVYNFLKFWDEYSNDLQVKIKAAKGIEGISTVDYGYVKEFIYAKYDYASILPFTDGLLKGVNDEKFTSADDIKDFMDHTLSKAFANQADSSAALLDSVLINNGSIGNINGFHPVSSMEAKMFDSIRNYAMFDRRSRPELYKAIDAVVKFMTTDIGIGKYIKTKDVKIFVSMINNIVDYMTYSLTAYATRIYIISAYTYPFILSRETAGAIVKPLREDGNNADPEVNGMEITVFRDADDIICRDPSKVKEFIEIFGKFTKLAGVDTLFGTRKPTYQNHWDGMENIESSAFCSKLTTNQLHEFLAGGCKEISFYSDRMSSTMSELNQILKECIYNNTQGLQGVSSPKQEMMHVIRGTSCDNTLKGYQGLAKDLYLFTIHMCCNIDTMIRGITEWKSNEQEYPKNNTTTYNSASESLKILSEFYRDLAMAIAQKARDIEININTLRENDADKTMNSLNLKIPNMKSDGDESNNMMTSVPDTTRLPTELIDLYDVPAFESMMLYDEYARNLPGMEDDLYYSEAFNISGLIDQIIAKIKSAWMRFKSFVDNKDVQKAFKWATEHERELISMDYSGAKMSVLPYKLSIALPAGYNNLTKGLAAFDSSKIKTKEDVQAFIKTLYPSDAVYEWFTGDKNKDGKYGAAMYRSFILFKDENEASETVPNPIEIDGAKITKLIPEWIKTLKAASETYDAYKKIGDDIEANIKSIRTKTVNISGENKSSGSTDAPPSMTEEKPKPASTGTSTSTSGNTATDAAASAASKANETPAAGTASAKPAENKDVANDTASIAGSALGDINVAMIRLYASLSSMFIEYTKSNYQYAKEAFTMGRKKQ